jgi:hypothetical protein
MPMHGGFKAQHNKRTKTSQPNSQLPREKRKNGTREREREKVDLCNRRS